MVANSKRSPVHDVSGKKHNLTNNSQQNFSKNKMNLNLCRACLDEKSSMYPLYEIYEHDLSLAMILENFLSVQLSKEDNLPSVLCEQCTQTLVQFYNFSVTYADSEEKLRTKLKGATIHKDTNSDEEQTKTGTIEGVAADDGESKTVSPKILSNHNNGANIIKNSPSAQAEPLKNFCVICKCLFPDQDTFDEHYKTHKSFVCEICGAGFIRMTYLNDHYDGHRDVYSYKCKFCGKAFKRRTVLVKHNRIHTRSAFCICEVCGRSFNSYDTLKTHIKIMHVKELNYACVLCGKKFTLKSTLNKHLKRHEMRVTGEKEFLCDKCDMRYRNKHSLSRHLKYKHGNVDSEDWSACNNCGKKYRSQINLRKHQKKVHSEINVSILTKDEIL